MIPQPPLMSSNRPGPTRLFGLGLHETSGERLENSFSLRPEGRQNGNRRHNAAHLPRRSLHQTVHQSDRMCSRPKAPNEQPAVIATVTDVQGLWIAVKKPGVEIIEVRHHLDLTNDFAQTVYIPETRLSDSVKMIRGNCSNAPPLPDDAIAGGFHTPLRDLSPEQCLILMNAGFISLVDKDMWLQNLYLRMHTKNPEDTNKTMMALVNADKATVVMTGVTMQGDGDLVKDCTDCGITMLSSLVYLQDLLVSDFHATTLMLASNASSAFVNNASFLNNTLVGPKGSVTGLGQGLADPIVGANIVALAGRCNLEEFPSMEDTLIRLEGVYFSNNGNFSPMVSQTAPSVSGRFFSDNLDATVQTFAYPKGCDSAARISDLQPSSPEPVQSAPKRFMSMEHEFVHNLHKLLAPGARKVCIEDWEFEHPELQSTNAFFYQPVSARAAQSPSASEWHSKDAFVIVLVCGGVLIAALIGVSLCTYKRMRRRLYASIGLLRDECGRLSKLVAEPSQNEPSHHLPPPSDRSFHDPSRHNVAPRDPSRNGSSQCEHSHHSAMEAEPIPESQESAASTVGSLRLAQLAAAETETGARWAAAPVQGGVVAGEGIQGHPTRHTPHYFNPTVDGLTRREATCKVREKMCKVGAVLHMPNNCRCEIKSIDWNRSSDTQMHCIVVAIVGQLPRFWDVVFHLTRLKVKGMEAAEAARTPVVKRFFEQPKFFTQDPDEGVLVTDPRGIPYPPFVMVPKHESLRERCQSNISRGVAVEVASHISYLLTTLHRVGFVHRHINFDNIIFVKSKWQLAWSPLSAPIGASAQLAAESQFCSPQQLDRIQKNELVDIANPSADIWALGLVLWELLLFRRAFYGKHDRKPDQIYSMLLDPEAKLPWHEPMDEYADWFATGFKNVIKGMLRHENRIDAEEVHRLINERFQNVGTVADTLPETPRAVAAQAPTSREEEVRAPRSAIALVNTHKRARRSMSPACSSNYSRSDYSSSTASSIGTHPASAHSQMHPIVEEPIAGRSRRHALSEHEAGSTHQVGYPDEGQHSFEGGSQGGYSEESGGSSQEEGGYDDQGPHRVSSILEAPETPSGKLHEAAENVHSWYSGTERRNSHRSRSAHGQTYNDDFVVASSDKVFTINETTGEMVLL